MEKEFVTYQQAIKLKELGFDEPCFAYFDCERESKFNPNKRMFLSCEILRPTLSQAFRWFRDKHHLHYPIQIQGNLWFFEKWSLNGFKTYEEAESACLDKLIEIVEKNNLEL